MKNLDSIRAAVISRYGSLEDPRFGFKREALKADPYRALIDTLKASFTLTEDTDINDDVSFGLVLQAPGGLRVLRLSMIGPYAALLRPAARGAYEAVDDATLANPAERRLRDVLRASGIELLDQATLSAPLPMELSNTPADRCRVYQALFVDADLLPWESI